MPSDTNVMLTPDLQPHQSPEQAWSNTGGKVEDRCVWQEQQEKSRSGDGGGGVWRMRGWGRVRGEWTTRFGHCLNGVRYDGGIPAMLAHTGWGRNGKSSHCVCGELNSGRENGAVIWRPWFSECHKQWPTKQKQAWISMHVYWLSLEIASKNADFKTISEIVMRSSLLNLYNNQRINLIVIID